MATRDPRVDQYIEKSADFAKPILTYVRATVHAACPAVEEAMKWSFPHFLYKGMLCSMAAFKAHAAFGFWKGSLVLGTGADTDAMGQFGRLTKVSDLPSKRDLTAMIKKAMALNEEGVTVPRPRRAPRKALPMPAELTAALRANKKAASAFEAFSPSHRREYMEWIGQAKGAETRKKRVATALTWLSAGKPRNWKYLRT
jgi:uncharacterized protein YdeI (YjbR/CyaY-like superfamily)